MTFLWVVVVAGLIAACSGGAADINQSDGQADVGEVDSLDGLVLPLEPLLMLGAEAKAVLDSAVDTLADECMSQLGFDYIPYPPIPPRPILNVAVRYGYLSPEEASTTGYATTFLPPQDPAFLEQVAEIDARRQAFGPSYEEALYGAREQGTGESGDASACYPAAQEEVYGAGGGIYNLPAYRALLDMQSRSSDELYASESAREVIAQWSECMRDAGYSSYHDWWEAREAFGQSDSVSEEERRQATTDAECRARVSLERTLFDIEEQILNRIIDQDPDLVRTYSSQLDESLDMASDLVGQG